MARESKPIGPAKEVGGNALLDLGVILMLPLTFGDLLTIRYRRLVILGESSLRSRFDVLDDAQRREQMSQEDDSMLLPAPDGDRLVARKNHDKPLIFKFNFPTR